ncbi:MAG: glycosyltransferase family 9 protein [Chloroflexi bacterium]|nr:glycosyltransferase family 9 protein [Chloroflexota bacterium]
MNLLVIKLSDMGDVLTTTPALRALRDRFPKGRISLLTPPQSASVVAGSSLVNEVITFDKRLFDHPWRSWWPPYLAKGIALWHCLSQSRFDALVVFHHFSTPWGAFKFALLSLASGAPLRAGLDNGRGWFLTHRAPDRGFGYRHEVEYWLSVASLLGASPQPRPMEVSFAPQDEAFAQGLIASLPGTGPLVALHPGGGEYGTARRWPVPHFAQVARQIIEAREARVVVVGGQREANLAQEVAQSLPQATNLVGKTTIGQLAALLRRSHLFIGNDSGLMHLAAASGTPGVAIFGPSNHRAWGPWACSVPWQVVRLELPCSPCLYVDGRVGKREGCSEKTCLLALEPRRVLAAALEILDNYDQVRAHIGS